jgi:tape measure domain-containing protein
MTPAIKSMLNGMNSMIAGFEKMETSSRHMIDTKSLSYARSEMAKAGAAFQQFEKSVSEANNEQKKFNSTASASTSSISGLVTKVGALAASYATLQGAQKLIDLSDTYSQTTARLSLMNDGLQTQQELQDKILSSANESHASYQATADMVSKLGLMAGDAFANNDEIIDFAEQVSKQFVISGAGASESSNAMLQLTQAMASGVLRGDELNSIFENAPTLIQSIADYLGVPIGQIRDMASDGEITADTIKKAMAKTANETDAKFEKMGMTFGQAWTVFQNKSSRAFQGVFEDLGQLANSQALDTFLNGLAGGVEMIGGVVETVGGILSGEIQGESGMLGFATQSVEDAKTVFGTAAVAFQTHSGEISQSLDGAKTAWDDLFDTINQDFGEFEASDFGTWVGDTGASMVQDLSDLAAQTAREAELIIDSLDLIFGNPSADIEEYGSSSAAWAAKKEKLEADYAEYQAAAEEIARRSQTDFSTILSSSGMESEKSFDTSSYTGFINQATTDIQTTVNTLAIPAIQQSGTDMSDALSKSITIDDSTIASAGASVGTNFSTAISGKDGEVKSATEGLTKTVKTNLEPTRKHAISIGEDSIAGFNNALNDQRTTASTVNALVDTVVGQFKSGLGIHSPSTVMYDIGENTMAGLLNAMSGEDLLAFCNSIVSDIQAAFEAGNFNLQVGTEFLGDGAKEFFQSIGVGGATVEGLIKPVDGAVTSGFGWRDPFMTDSGEMSSSYHGGIDIGAAYGTPVGAAGAGEVTTAGWHGGYGNTVIIDHGNGLESLYGHLSSILVGLHDMVTAGQTIGLVGSTGNSTGPHLHFGIYQDGSPIDPSALYGYASGTMSARSGLRLVGENGPEIVNFAGGESVMNSKKTKRFFAGDYAGGGRGGSVPNGDIFVNVSVGSISNELDAKNVGKIIAAELQDSRTRRPTVTIN